MSIPALLKRIDRLTERLEHNRYIDLALQFRIKETGALLTFENGSPTVGGRWDRRKRNAAGGHGCYVPPAGGQGAAPFSALEFIISQQQAPLIAATGRHVVGIGGRRGGKSEALARQAIKFALQFASKLGQVVSPTYKKARIVWNKILRLLPRGWLLPGKAGIKRSDRELHLWNGSTIQFLSADHADALRGEGLAWVLFDERQNISGESYWNAVMSLSEGGAKFHIFEVGTAKSTWRDHYLKCLEDPECQIVRLTLRDNPFVDPALEKYARQRHDPRMAAQELDAEFTVLAGRCLWTFDRELHVREHRPAADGIAAVRSGEKLLRLVDETRSVCGNLFERPDAEYVIGVDYGVAPFSCSVYKLYQGEIAWQIDELAIDEGGDARIAAQRLKEHGYYPAVVVDDAFDSRFGKAGARWFRSYGFKVVHPRRDTRVENRMALFRARQLNGEGDIHWFIDPCCKRTIEAIENLVYGANEKPDKEHGWDHAVDSSNYPLCRLYPVSIPYEQMERPRS